MSTNFLMKPSFDREEIVRFAGGVGTIKSYQPESNTWTYMVEMEMGPEPEFGRVGFETMILLYEEEIQRC
jgi:hypothetical protein